MSLELRIGSDLEWRSLGSLRGFAPVETLHEINRVKGQVNDKGSRNVLLGEFSANFLDLIHS